MPFSASLSPGGRDSKAKGSLQPVTVMQLVRAIQLHAADDSQWTIEGAEVGLVSWVDSSILFDAEMLA